ncbi:MAG: hypothetical protein EPO68_02155 [Planctomycetota bacterium]|nr:MAG: hypothetical protein EPO68_02155 [Planctomycetota bacterium]
MPTLPRLAFLLTVLSGSAAAQWNPAAGQWGKTDATDVRVMTWNVRDSICSSNDKQEGNNDWCAIARIVAALKPDVLILQECADNEGQGSGSGIDSVANLSTTLNRFQYGGTDPFNGNVAITSWVRKYAPTYDLPFWFVSSDNDGFNRDVILSRHPFGDLNGDGKNQYSDTPNIGADLWAPGGDGGIRGFQHAELNLPDASYAGDLVVGNSHLKAGSQASDKAERLVAAQNIAYYLDAFYNGLGLGSVDPHGKIADSPAATSVLPVERAIVIGGDWNEDESQNGTKGPAEWLTRGAASDPVGSSGGDGVDRNRTDMSFDDARDVFTNSAFTVTTAKFDYLGWQDSVIWQRRAFVFNSATLPGGAVPAELAGYTGGTAGATATASDHKPVVADFVLLPALGCNTAGTNLGYAKIGGAGKFPRFSACGSLATGGSATLSLVDARPSSIAYLALGLNPGLQLALGGTLVPLNAQFLGPYATDANGAVTIPGIAGGGGPFSVVVQWGILDLFATQSTSFSNALRLNFLP